MDPIKNFYQLRTHNDQFGFSNYLQDTTTTLIPIQLTAACFPSADSSTVLFSGLPSQSRARDLRERKLSIYLHSSIKSLPDQQLNEWMDG